MESILIFAGMIGAVVVAVVEMIKQTAPKMPKNLIPVISFLVGIMIALAAVPFTDLDTVSRLWAGVFAGLAATGLFELAFNPRQGTVGK